MDPIGSERVVGDGGRRQGVVAGGGERALGPDVDAQHGVSAIVAEPFGGSGAPARPQWDADERTKPVTADTLLPRAVEPITRQADGVQHE